MKKDKEITLSDVIKWYNKYEPILTPILRYFKEREQQRLLHQYYYYHLAAIHRSLDQLAYNMDRQFEYISNQLKEISLKINNHHSRVNSATKLKRRKAKVFKIEFKLHIPKNL